MRALIQRVSHASVVVEDKTIGQIDKGLLVFLGVGEGDEPSDLDYIVKKVSGLRIFPDVEGKMNLALDQIKGEILLISQFTLHADTKKGFRPSFIRAAKPESANKFYEQAIAAFRGNGIKVATGEFGADMKVSLLNDGPVTIWIDSKDR